MYDHPAKKYLIPFGIFMIILLINLAHNYQQLFIYQDLMYDGKYAIIKETNPTNYIIYCNAINPANSSTSNVLYFRKKQSKSKNKLINHASKRCLSGRMDYNVILNKRTDEFFIINKFGKKISFIMKNKMVTILFGMLTIAISCTIYVWVYYDKIM